MPHRKTNGPFVGLVSAIGLLVVIVALACVAIVVGVGTGSWLAGVLAFAAMMLMVGVAVWKAPGVPME